MVFSGDEWEKYFDRAFGVLPEDEFIECVRRAFQRYPDEREIIYISLPWDWDYEMGCYVSDFDDQIRRVTFGINGF